MKCPKCKSHITFYPHPDDTNGPSIGICDNLDCDYQTQPYQDKPSMLREYIEPAIVVSMLFLIVGCQSSAKKWAVTAESQNSVKILRAMTQETVTLLWQSNYDPQPTDLTWTTEIHTTTNLLFPFEYLTETTNGFLLVPIQHNQQFFIIRNRYGLEWSDWNIKQ